MNRMNKKGLFLGAMTAVALLLGIGGQYEALARVLGRLYGNSLHIENEPRSGAPGGFTIGNNDAYIKDSLEVDGTSFFDAALKVTATEGVAVSSSATANYPTRSRGMYTSTQLSTLSAAPGDTAWNITNSCICYSSATTTPLAGAWILPRSTSTTANIVACDDN